VLRSYFDHEALEVKLAADEIDDGDVSDYPEAIREVDEMSTKHGIDANDARDGVLLYRVGSDREADLVVTGREWLLAERGLRALPPHNPQTKRRLRYVIGRVTGDRPADPYRTSPRSRRPAMPGCSAPPSSSAAIGTRPTICVRDTV
jgi:hypothetical protein